jgi:hypothetical protein
MKEIGSAVVIPNSRYMYCPLKIFKDINMFFPPSIFKIIATQTIGKNVLFPTDIVLPLIRFPG